MFCFDTLCSFILAVVGRTGLHMLGAVMKGRGTIHFLIRPVISKKREKSLRHKTGVRCIEVNGRCRAKHTKPNKSMSYDFW